jgi:hypothetical protein
VIVPHYWRWKAVRAGWNLTMVEVIRDIVANSVTTPIMGVGRGTRWVARSARSVTGIPTLAPGSFLSLAAIVAGAVVGVKYLERYSVK